jgi:HK97 family phage major capsid protein
MNITDENKAIAARKSALEFHKRHSIKSLNELTPHTMNWADLNGLEKDTRKEATAVLDRASSSTTEQRESIELALDGLTDLLTEIRSEKDERTFVGNKGPREERATLEQLSKRPGFPTGVVDTTDTMSGTEGNAIALRSGESFRSWAQARSPVGDNLRGMNAGQFLRAMIVQDKSDVERRALSEASDSAGGYTVPDILSAELIDKARAASVVMQAGARTVPLTSDKNTIAKVLTDPTPAWREEAGAVSNSDGTFGAVVLTPRSLAVSVDISSRNVTATNPCGGDGCRT